MGLLPLCAVSVYRPEVIRQLPRFQERVIWFNENRPELLANVGHPGQPGVAGRFMLSLLEEKKLRRVLAPALPGVLRVTSHSMKKIKAGD